MSCTTKKNNHTSNGQEETRNAYADQPNITEFTRTPALMEVDKEAHKRKRKNNNIKDTTELIDEYEMTNL